MNTMTVALVKAGVSLPTAKERIWRAIKEQPGIRLKDIRARYPDIPEGTVASTLHVMAANGMIYVKHEMRKNMRIHNYYTDLETYTVLPAKNKKPVEPQPVKNNPVMVAVAGSIYESELTRLVDNLTISQARKLYGYLKEMFK